MLQRLAAQTLDSELIKLETAYPSGVEGSSHVGAGALVAIDPATGGILAMVGSRDYRMSQFNRAAGEASAGIVVRRWSISPPLEARRELAGGQPITPATAIVDEPVTFDSGAASGAAEL